MLSRLKDNFELIIDAAGCGVAAGFLIGCMYAVAKLFVVMMEAVL